MKSLRKLEASVLSQKEQALLLGGGRKWYVKMGDDVYEVTQQEYKDIYASATGQNSAN